jgi:hypothetical protein
VFVFTILASNDGLYGPIPADPPSTRVVTLTVFAPPPMVTSITPNVVASNTTGITFSVHGSGFIGFPGDPLFSNFAIILSNSDQGMITVSSPTAVATSGTSVTFTISSIPPSPVPYDVSVRNEDGQIGTLKGGLIVVGAGISTAGAARLTSLDSAETPIFTSSASNQTTVPRPRAFALGTNVEFLFYSGRDIPNNKLLNVYRKQQGSTSTRHGAGDLVFPGMLSVQASPTEYLTNGGPIGAVYCLVRSNGSVTMRVMTNGAITQIDDTSLARASYQVVLVSESPTAPVFDLEEQA